MCIVFSPNQSELDNSSTQRLTTVRMTPTKRTYAEVLKTPFPALNPRLESEPLIRKPVRANLTKEAKANLRAMMKDKPIAPLKQPAVMFPGGFRKPQQVTLATASDWVMSGATLINSFNPHQKEENTSASVRLMQPNEITSVIREGKLENPIEVCDDSDVETLKYDESLVILIQI